jgi:hypothetical protein
VGLALSRSSLKLLWKNYPTLYIKINLSNSVQQGCQVFEVILTWPLFWAGEILEVFNTCLYANNVCMAPRKPSLFLFIAYVRTLSVSPAIYGRPFRLLRKVIRKDWKGSSKNLIWGSCYSRICLEGWEKVPNISIRIISVRPTLKFDISRDEFSFIPWSVFLLCCLPKMVDKPLAAAQIFSIYIYKYVCVYIYWFQNVFLPCPTHRLHGFLSSRWPSFRFLSFMAFLIPSIQFSFGLPRALFCFDIHFNAILGNLPSAIFWTWPYHVSWFCSIFYL